MSIPFETQITHTSVTLINDHYKVMYTTTTNQAYKSSLEVGTMWNCQVSVIGGIEDLLFMSQDNTLKILKYIYKLNQKPLMMIDIATSKVDAFKKFVNIKHTVMQDRFISTNDDDRTILIFHLKNLLNE